MCYKRRPVRNVDRALYVIFAGVFTLAVARVFYGYMLLQTGGEWSAPLDDVFIHFDYARATARGYPFQWSAGNGYSSGNTSLALSFRARCRLLGGFRGPRSHDLGGRSLLCVAIFGLLLAAQGCSRRCAAWAKYLAPPALFSVGALDWSLFSGMEVALYLGIWAGAFHAAWSRIAEPGGALRERRSELSMGTPSNFRGLGARSLGSPLGGDPARRGDLDRCARAPRGPRDLAKRRRGTRAARCWCGRACPRVSFSSLQAIANRVLTGEFSASGAIVKLTLYNPYMTAREKLDEYSSFSST